MAVGAEHIPRVFDLLVLRGGSRFRSLKDHEFSTAEKLWACCQMSHQVAHGTTRYMALKTFSCRYGLSSEALDIWMHSFHNGDELLRGRCTSPSPSLRRTCAPLCPIDDAGIRVINAFLSNDVGSEVGDLQAQVAQLVSEQLEATNTRRAITSHRHHSA
jgi:hypothetical protein